MRQIEVAVVENEGNVCKRAGRDGGEGQGSREQPLAPTPKSRLERNLQRHPEKGSDGKQPTDEPEKRAEFELVLVHEFTGVRVRGPPGTARAE